MTRLSLLHPRHFAGAPREEYVIVPKEKSFSPEEHQRRLAAVRSEMAAQEIDVLIVFSSDNVYYLTGYCSVNSWDFQACILSDTGEPVLLLFAFEMGRFLASSWLSDVVLYAAEDDPLVTAMQLLGDLGLSSRKLGIEDDSPNLGVAKYKRLQNLLRGKRWRDVSGLVDQVRLVKSEEEVACLREAGRLSCMAAQSALDQVAEGVYDHDLASVAYSTLRRNGSDFMCMEPIIAIGHRSGLAHSTVDHIPIRHGDSVFVELGACVRRYTAPVMRTTVAGPMPAERARLLEAADLAVQTIVDTARDGTLASEVAAAAFNKAIKPVVDQVQFHYNFGYSVGIGFPPDWLEPSHFFIQLTNHVPLREGMTFHLPFTLRVLGAYGVGTSETILIRKGGAEILTRL
jgi:Xaa-Pro aminopeptidase